LRSPAFLYVTRKIPVPAIAAIAAVLIRRYSHAEIDQFMSAAGVGGDPPLENKFVKTKVWLNRANEDANSDPLATLGKILIQLMEVDIVGYGAEADLTAERIKIQGILATYGLRYIKGGSIVTTGLAPIRQSIEDIIRAHDLAGLQTEFERISGTVESDPAAAVTASCALLEALFKAFISEERLEMPADKTIKPLWNVVRKNLNLEPDKLQNEDVRAILVGLGSIVEGLGSLRTHRGSAHGHVKQVKVKPRHARLTSHAAFTLASFIVETWEERSG
jgi:hypothetical protein